MCWVIIWLQNITVVTSCYVCDRRSDCIRFVSRFLFRNKWLHYWLVEINVVVSCVLYRSSFLTAYRVITPFCIAPCLVHLFCSLTVENYLVLEPDDDWQRVNKRAQITRQDDVPLKLSQKVIRQLRWKNEPGTWDTTQTLYVRVRLKVTIFLYLRPNRMTRSRSTLIAVGVEKDTEHNTYIVCYAGCVKWVSAKTPVFVNHGYPIVSIERPYNYTACHISNRYSLKCSINLRHHQYPKSNRKILLLFPLFCRLSVATKRNIPS